MEESIKSVLINYCKEIDKDPNIIIPIIQKLEENWFFNLKDLENLDQELWKQLGLPLNLFLYLMKKRNAIISASSSNVPDSNKQITTTEKNQSIHPEKIAQNVTMIEEEIETNPEVGIEQYVIAYCNEIVNEINKWDIYVQIFKNLHLVIGNILKNPNDEKYKRIKADSQFLKNYIFPYESVSKLFKWCSFKDMVIDGKPYYVFSGDIEQLKTIFKWFNEFLLNQKIIKLEENKGFNPFSGSITSTNAEKMPEMNLNNFEDLLKKEKIRRNEIIKNSTKCERRVKIFLIKEGQYQGILIENLNHEYESKLKEENELSMAAIKLIKDNRENEKFKIKARVEYEKLLSTPLYTKAAIRIKFPNETLVQAEFGVMEKIGDLYTFVNEILNEAQEFSLFITPPKKVFSNMDSTLRSENLAPYSLIYINFPKIDPLNNPNYVYINPSVISKYKTDFK